MAVVKQDVMDAVEKDPYYIQRKKEIRERIGILEGKQFDIREEARALYRENQELYAKVYDRIYSEMEAAEAANEEHA